MSSRDPLKFDEKIKGELSLQNPAFSKVYVESEFNKNISVGHMLVNQHPTKNGNLSEYNPPIPIYDTGGPYTDKSYEIDVNKGIPKFRLEWIKEREKKYNKNLTQMELAKLGIITAEMEYIASRENMLFETIINNEAYKKILPNNNGNYFKNKNMNL